MSTPHTNSVPGSPVETKEDIPLGVGQRVILASIHAYQGLRAGRPSPCRFYPSCSAYAVEAVEKHGMWRGSLLAIRRISRCHPFGGHGVDLVPLHQGRADRELR